MRWLYLLGVAAAAGAAMLFWSDDPTVMLRGAALFVAGVLGVTLEHLAGCVSAALRGIEGHLRAIANVGGDGS